MRMIGVYLNDPDIVPAEKLPSMEASMPCFVTSGPYAGMPKAYQWL